jgi:hypothetical protein
MREDQIDQAEKLRVTLQDADVRRQQQEQTRAGTFFSHAQAAANDTAGGRFGSLGSPHVVGSQATPRYPAAPDHQRDPVGTEPPLGVSVNDMPIEPSALIPCAEQLGGAVAAPPSSSSLSSGVERAAPPSFSANDEERR